jgi:HD-GYP domain-containing protein (c-di-GMP phosphodiesterase class II)
VYAVKIGQQMGLNDDRLEDIRAAALLHDIGKLDISRELLYKAARLTADEYEEVKTHVSRGARMLEPVGGSLRRVLPIVLSHHDSWDGSGYNPQKGTEIPLEARILAVADTYDAMTSDRPYRKGIVPHEAVELIEKKAGSQYDPSVVEAFVHAFARRELEVPELVI